MSEISIHPDKKPRSLGEASYTDDMILADQIRHSYDPDDVPDVDERIPSSLQKSLDLPRFPDWNGTLPEGRVSRPTEYDPGKLGTVGSQLDMRDHLAVPVSFYGPGVISAERGFLRGWASERATVTLADGAPCRVVLTDKSGKIIAPLGTSFVAAPYSIPFDGLEARVYLTAEGRYRLMQSNDAADFQFCIAYITPMEGI